MTMRYMLDTDVASYVIRGMDATLNRRVMAHAGRLCMSAVTYHELLYGARRRGSTRLLETINVLTELVPVVDFSSDAAARSARIRATLDAKGQTIGVMDTLIAANALSAGCTLVTNNTDHFSRITGLSFENWVSKGEK